MDTGASAHMSSDAGNLTSLASTPPHTHIMVGDGSSIPVANSGHTSLSSSSRRLTLRDVLVTPCIVKILIYVRPFTRDNLCSVEFDLWGFSMKDLSTGVVILRCSSRETSTRSPPRCTPSPSLPPTPPFGIGVSVTPGLDAFRRLVSTSSLPMNKVLKDPSLHHACQLGRHVGLPFYVSTTHTECPFELIHCDLWTSPSRAFLATNIFLSF
jgi:hypothetical protein